MVEALLKPIPGDGFLFEMVQRNTAPDTRGIEIDQDGVKARDIKQFRKYNQRGSPAV